MDRVVRERGSETGNELELVLDLAALVGAVLLGLLQLVLAGTVLEGDVDLRHLVSGCGCEKAGSSIRYGEMLECWSVEWLKCVEGRKVSEVWKK